MPQPSNATFCLMEGMRAGDLADLILPLVSIDEFESKIDDHAIVIGFYVTDRDAADDLNRYIQRSPTEILDSDISPAPDQNGHYMVFVELLNNVRTAEQIVDIVDEVSPLCSLDAWEAQIRGADEILPFKLQSIKEALTRNGDFDRAQKTSTTETSLRERVIFALNESNLDDAHVVDKEGATLVSLRQHGARHDFSVLAAGQDLAMLEKHIPVEATDLSLTALCETNRIRRMLGPNWEVMSFGVTQVWLRDDETCLIVQPFSD